MLRPKLLLTVLMLLLVGGTAFAQWTEYPDASSIFVTRIYGGDGWGTEFLEIHEGDGYYATPLRNIYPSRYESIVYGPDEWLYACDPYAGKIIRFDPADEGSVQDVYTYSDQGPELHRPRCGWFTHTGDLVVTDAYDDPSSGVWLFPGIAALEVPPPPINVVGTDVLGAFRGGAVTQNANGALLYVDRGGPGDFDGRVLNTPFDADSGAFEPSLTADVVTGMAFPLGLARLSTGPFFTTEQNTAMKYEKNGTFACKHDFPTDEVCTTSPQFLAVSANDWVYATTQTYCDYGEGDDYSGALYAIGGECPLDPVPIFDDDSEYSYLSGVALPPTARSISLDFDVEGDGDLVFDFADHVYEVEALGSCDASNTAIQTPPGCIVDLLPTGDDQPDAVPVIYLGEGGFANVYNLRTYSGEGSETCTVTTEGFLHSASAYVELLDNPTLVRCEGDVAGYEGLCDSDFTPACEFLDLASFFPFDGNLPDDGRIASKSDTFSLYFLVDYGLAGGGAGTGSWCGFRNPVMNAYHPTDPMSSFRAGRSIPLKFKVAEGAGGDCGHGPFIAPEGILLSIARVAPDFAVQEIVCTGGGCGEVPYFDPPNNPNAGFHMNIQTDGFAPGTYQAVLVATGGDFPVAWTYFEIVP